MRQWFWMVGWASFLLFGQAQDAGKIPTESEGVLRKLREWEFKERAELEAELAVKREEVQKVLQRHLETHTKRGDLMTANAILEEIKKLENEGVKGPGGMTFELPWQEGKLEGVVWVTFHSDGTATWENKVAKKTFEKGFRWSREDSRAVKLWFQSADKAKGMSWSFARDFTSARVRHRKDGSNLKSTRVR